MTVRELVQALSLVSKESGPDAPVYFDSGLDDEPVVRIGEVDWNPTPTKEEITSDGGSFTTAEPGVFLS
jgi:hypothetical protein